MARREQRGCRTLNAVVPESVYWLVRRCATESQLSVKAYLARFCAEAHPFGATGHAPDASAIGSQENDRHEQDVDTAPVRCEVDG